MSNKLVYSPMGYFYNNLRPYVSNVNVSLCGFNYSIKGEKLFDDKKIVGFFSGYPCKVINDSIFYGIQYSCGFIKLNTSKQILILDQGNIVGFGDYYKEHIQNQLTENYFECDSFISIDQFNKFDFEKDFKGPSIGFFVGNISEKIHRVIDGATYSQKKYGFNFSTGRIVFIPYDLHGGFHYLLNCGDVKEIPLDIVSSIY